jgi:hypothetical protein
MIWILFAYCILPVRAQAASSVILSKGQLVYTPIYSHIYSGNREHPFYLAATLSIRNTDPDHPITIMIADYYDSEGKVIRKYLEKPLQLGPMAAVRYVIKESDKSGGSGASFLVKWRSDENVSAPIIESVMIGTQTQQGISFTSRGQSVRE